MPDIEPTILIRDDPPNGVRVGRCDGAKPFVARVEPARVILFVFDHAGHLLSAQEHRAAGGGDSDDQQPLTAALGQLEPYTFEDVARVRPFSCRVAGQTASLAPAADGQGVRLTAAGRSTWLMLG